MPDQNKPETDEQKRQREERERQERERTGEDPKPATQKVKQPHDPRTPA